MFLIMPSVKGAGADRVMGQYEILTGLKTCRQCRPLVAYSASSSTLFAIVHTFYSYLNIFIFSIIIIIIIITIVYMYLFLAITFCQCAIV